MKSFGRGKDVILVSESVVRVCFDSYGSADYLAATRVISNLIRSFGRWVFRSLVTVLPPKRSRGELFSGTVQWKNCRKLAERVAPGTASWFIGCTGSLCTCGTLSPVFWSGFSRFFTFFLRSDFLSFFSSASRRLCLLCFYRDRLCPC